MIGGGNWRYRDLERRTAELAERMDRMEVQVSQVPTIGQRLIDHMTRCESRAEDFETAQNQRHCENRMEFQRISAIVMKLVYAMGGTLVGLVAILLQAILTKGH